MTIMTIMECWIYSLFPISLNLKCGPRRAHRSEKIYNYRVGQKKCVLGCVIPPAGAVSRSRNLRQTFLPKSVQYN